MAREQTLTAQVRDRVLWIGAEAYPVRNITRAETLRIVPRRGAAVGSFLGFVAVVLVLSVVAALGLSRLGGSGLGWPELLVVVAVMVVIGLVRMFRVLLRPDEYALVIETSGASSAFLVSRARGVIDEVVRAVMAAINDPRAGGTFHLKVINKGDRNNYGGTYNEVRGQHNKVRS